MRKYLIGEIDCWLKYEPTEDISKCWKTSGSHSVYNIHGIWVFEDEALIKVLEPAPFVEVWMEAPKDFDHDVYTHFCGLLLKYIEDNLK